MCTVTFLPRRRGYALAMNRDEKLTRVKGLPPSEKTVRGRTVICPSEPGGGTWIALNDSGITFALINWYSITAQVKGEAASRGKVVNAVSAAVTLGRADDALAELPLNKISPFRLIGVFPDPNGIAEWRWDLKRLVRKNHPWEAQQWISSGFDEPKAQRIRSETFQRALKQKSAGSLDWLRRLHRSHSPQSGPFSTCMHRTDAATVSYSEVSVSPNGALLGYHAGSPCNGAAAVAPPINSKSRCWRRSEMMSRRRFDWSVIHLRSKDDVSSRRSTDDSARTALPASAARTSRAHPVSMNALGFQENSTAAF